jgi:hypothetical protein
VTEQNETWGRLLATCYDQHIENSLRDAARWSDLWRKDHDEWWAQQSRWFKTRYRLRRKSRGVSQDVRQWIADRIYPEGRDYQ